MATSTSRSATKAKASKAPAKAPAKATSKAPAKVSTKAPAATKASKAATTPAKAAPSTKAPASVKAAPSAKAPASVKAPVSAKAPVKSKAVAEAEPSRNAVSAEIMNSARRASPSAARLLPRSASMPPPPPPGMRSAAPPPPPPPRQPSTPHPLKRISAAPEPQPTLNLKLKVGDKAVHLKHGVGEVVAIQEMVFGGTKGTFYVFNIFSDPSKTTASTMQKTMVPTQGQRVLRAVMSEAEAESVMETMRAKEVAVNEHPWSRRFRAYQEMISSGSPFEVAKVMRDMHRLKFDKDLSFGERRLLDQAKALLLKELALAKGVADEVLCAEVDAIFATA